MLLGAEADAGEGLPGLVGTAEEECDVPALHTMVVAEEPMVRLKQWKEETPTHPEGKEATR